MLPPLQGEALAGASHMRGMPAARPDHEPSWSAVILALALLVWAFNWRRGKPGLIQAILRQIRR